MIMRNRNVRYQLFLDDDEFRKLAAHAQKCKMSQSSFLRHLINNKTPVELPPADYHALVREVRMLGNNLNQIAAKANAQGLLDVPLFKRHADTITAVADKLTMVCLPRDNLGSPRSSQTSWGEERPRSDEPFDQQGESDKQRVT
jgi:hypothetical protein